jgi:hypothetical protein
VFPCSLLNALASAELIQCKGAQVIKRVALDCQ